MTTRRHFFRQSAWTAAAIGVGTGSLGVRTLGAQGDRGGDTAISSDTALRFFDDADRPTLRELAMRAIDAARSGGAQFADVRITDKRNRYVGSGMFNDRQHIAVGVRVLVDGAWGLSASPYWRLDEMSRLAADAIDQAKGNNWGTQYAITLAGIERPASGEWSTPIQRDAFAMHPQEIMDYNQSVEDIVRQERRYGRVSLDSNFLRKDRLYASTEGAYTTQRTYTVSGSIKVISALSTTDSIQLDSPRFGPTGGSYEVLTSLPIIDEEVPWLLEHAMRMRQAKPVDVGRYDIVFDAYAMASIVGFTFGLATEIDRARGYEANAGGTSYLSPIADILGGKPVASSLLSVRANRTDPRGAATVRWDDEGVATGEFDLIREGRLVDYSTSREHVAVMQEWYAKQHMAAVSRACGYSEDAMGFPLVGVPNLAMQPGPRELSFEDLIADTKNGLAVIAGGVNMDHQQVTGQGSGLVTYRIRDGKLDHVVAGAGYLFRSPELWGNLIAIGGPSSLRSRGLYTSKGQPVQSMSFTVSAVPAKITGLAVINLLG